MCNNVAVKRVCSVRNRVYTCIGTHKYMYVRLSLGDQHNVETFQETDEPCVRWNGTLDETPFPLAFPSLLTAPPSRLIRFIFFNSLLPPSQLPPLVAFFLSLTLTVLQTKYCYIPPTLLTDKHLDSLVPSQIFL